MIDADDPHPQRTVVDEDVQPSKARTGLGDCGLAFLIARDVGANGDEAACSHGFLVYRREFVEPLLVNVERGHLRAGSEQATHQLPSESAGRPGDDGNLAFKLHVHQ